MNVDFTRMEEVACDSYAFSKFDVDGEPNPLLSKISSQYLLGEISREEYRAQTMEAVELLEQEYDKNNNNNNA